MASLGARQVTDLEVMLPPAGGWEGRLHLASGAPPAAGASVLTIGDLVLRCRILPARGGLDSPEHPAVVVAGGYGWRTPLPVGSYSSPGGVRLSTVLAVLAGAAGEGYEAPAEAKLGPSYGWSEGTRGRVVLADLVARGMISTWRADPLTGSTLFAPWPTLPPADAHGVVDDRALAWGIRYVKVAGSVKAWLPGATVQGVRIARVTIREHDSETTIETRDA